MKLEIKPGVLLDTRHFANPYVCRIIQFAGEEWPQTVTITRGCEDCIGSKPTSKHFQYCAFDFRCRDLPPDVDRPALLRRIMDRLGPAYYGYYRSNAVTEWIHVQFNL